MDAGVMVDLDPEQIYEDVRKGVKKVGMGAGKVALKLGYPILGALPNSAQDYLKEHFESYNKYRASEISGGLEVAASITAAGLNLLNAVQTSNPGQVVLTIPIVMWMAYAIGRINYAYNSEHEKILMPSNKAYMRTEKGVAGALPIVLSQGVYAGIKGVYDNLRGKREEEDKEIKEYLTFIKSKVLEDKDWESGSPINDRKISDKEYTAFRIRRKLVNDSKEECPTCLFETNKGLLFSDDPKIYDRIDVENEYSLYLEGKSPLGPINLKRFERYPDGIPLIKDVVYLRPKKK